MGKRKTQRKTLIKVVGDNVLHWRIEANLTQTQLGARMSTSSSYVSGIEQGESERGPTVALLEKIAGALNIKPESLFKR